MPTMQCPECISSHVVWNWADGDVVCTGCGLVIQERFIDDRVGFRESDDYSPPEPAFNAGVKRQLTKANVRLPDNVLSACHEGCVATTSVRKEHVAVAMHANTQGVSVKAVCATMGVKPSKFWKEARNLKGHEENVRSQLRRTVYECVLIDEAKHWDVLKTATRLMEGVINHPRLYTLKPDKLAVSLMVVACKICKLSLKRGRLCKEYGLSLDTLGKHESMIQEALAKKFSSSTEEKR